MVDEEEKPSTSTIASEHPPLSNLRRFDGTDALLRQDSKLRNGSSNLEFRHSFTANPNEEEDPYFDSSDYRCCLGLFHAKIAAFVFCTWIFHEIVGGTIYLCSQLEVEHRSIERIALLIVCRLAQLPTVALLYVGLWRHRRRLIIPFAVVQFTLGIFADLSTLHMLLDHLKEMGTLPMFEGNLRWLNFALPTALYIVGVLWLAWVLHMCYRLLAARNAHDEKRQQQRQLLQQQQQQRNSNSAPSSPNGVVEVLQEGAPQEAEGPPVFKGSSLALGPFNNEGEGNGGGGGSSRPSPSPRPEQESLLAQSSV